MKCCPYCGAECRPGANYCRNCGNRFTSRNDASDSVKLLYIYAHADKLFSYELDKHLHNLQRQGVIAEWEGQVISIDTDADHHLGVKLDKTYIILLLVSPEFLASNYCYGVEMKQILAQHRAGSIAVTAVLLRPTELKYSPFKNLPTLPSEEETITQYHDRDEAFFYIEEGISKTIASLPVRRSHQGVGEPQQSASEQVESPEAVNTDSATVFCAYVPEDEELCNELKLHLRILQKQGIIAEVYYHEISGITTYEDNTVDPHLYNANIILFLASPDFFISDYYSGSEMLYAVKRQEMAEARILPIILRPVDWHSSSFDGLQVFPSNGVPITRWTNRDEAFLNIAQGIRMAVSNLLHPQETTEAKEAQQDISEVPIKPERIDSGPINIYYSYAHEDEELLKGLQMHMSMLRRQGLIVDLDDRKIMAGTLWDEELVRFINSAQLILLLISPSFLASDYLYDIELVRALERQESGDALVVPIILRPVGWQNMPINRFRVLPPNGIPVTSQPDRDTAFSEIVTNIRQIVWSLLEQSRQRTKEQYILEGQTFYNNQQYNEALAAYEQALLIDQTDDLVCVTIGRLLLHLERYEEALTTYEQVLRIAPAASTYLFKGLILQRLGRSADALLAYQQARAYGYSG